MKVLKVHFHADCDGIISAYFLTKELDRLGKSYTLHPSLGGSTEFRNETNISLDISNVENKTGSKLNLSIDHHVTPKYDFFHVNPRFAGFEWPVSFLSYVLFGSEKESWVAAIGVVADWCAERVPKTFWEIVKRHYPFLVNSLKQEELVKGPIGEMALMIDASVAVNKQDGAIYALKALKHASSPEEFLNGEGRAKRLLKLKEKIEREVEEIMGNEIVTANFVLLKFSSKYHIKSLVAARMKEKYPNKLIIVAQEENAKIRLSFRNGNNLDKLVKELVHGIGDGGGHPKASGGWIRKEYWEEFKRRVFERFS